jgi:hypothetical protein
MFLIIAGPKGYFARSPANFFSAFILLFIVYIGESAAARRREHRREHCTQWFAKPRKVTLT